MPGALNVGTELVSFESLSLLEHFPTITSQVGVTLVLPILYIQLTLVATCVYWVFVGIHPDEEAGLLISNTAYANICF